MFDDCQQLSSLKPTDNYTCKHINPHKFQSLNHDENFIMAQTKQNNEFKNLNLHANKILIQLGSKVNSIATHNIMLET